MTEEEAQRTIEEMNKEMEEQAATEAVNQEATGGLPSAGMESAENTPPTANESTESPIEFMLNRTLDEEAKEVMSRIVKKQKQKAEELLES